MRRCMEKLTPDTVVHLGDYFDDGLVIAQENPGIVFHQVPGNCDRFRCPPGQQETLCYSVGGAVLFMTHGHTYGVKFGKERLLAAARSQGAQAVLYGHTHIPDCRREPDGLWVLNPGSCSSDGGTAGLIVTGSEGIVGCRILTLADLL